MNTIERAYPEVDTFKMSGLLRWLDQWAWRKSPRVIVSSENLKKQLTSEYGWRDDVDIVPHGVEGGDKHIHSALSSKSNFGIEANDFVVGFVGRLDPCKDLPFVFRALKQLPNDVNVKFLVVGDGPDEQRLKLIASELGVMDKIVWAGRLDEPSEGYAVMDVMVLPSVYESFGNVVLEAMSAGCGVIARRYEEDAREPVWTASEELIHDGKTGWLVGSHDHEQLSRLINELSQRNTLVKKVGEFAKEKAHAYTWTDTTKKYCEILGVDRMVSEIRQAA